MKPELPLLKTFASTFVAYYKSHAAHWNTTGRTFYNDHKLLNKIYEDLFNSVDDIAEIIRTLQSPVPTTLTEITVMSEVSDSPVFDSDEGRDLLQAVYDDLEILIDVFHELEDATDSTEYSHINNFCQERVKALQKFCWMLRSTLA
jgi:starvation-inducible DNA-binding protein